MQNNNQNSAHSWRKRIDELDHLEDESMPDIELSWEKLHRRLDPKSRRNKYLLYWVAAGLTGILLFPWSSFNHFHKTVQKPIIDQLAIKKGIDSSQETKKMVNEKAVSIMKTNPVDIKQPVEKVPIHFVKEGKDSVTKEFVLTPAPTPAIKSLPDTQTANVQVFTSNEKKKIGIMHINELPGPGKLNNENNPYQKFMWRSGSNVTQGTIKIPSATPDHILVKNLN